MIKQFYLTHTWDPNRLDLGGIEINGYSTFPKAPGLEPYHRMVQWQIQDTYILQHQLTGLWLCHDTYLTFNEILQQKMKLATQVQSWMRLFAFHFILIYVFGKGRNPSLLENSEFKLATCCLKINLVPNLAHGGGVG